MINPFLSMYDYHVPLEQMLSFSMLPSNSLVMHFTNINGKLDVLQIESDYNHRKNLASVILLCGEIVV